MYVARKECHDHNGLGDYYAVGRERFIRAVASNEPVYNNII